MKNNIRALCLFILMAVSLAGCTDNQKARSFGGTSTITLTKGEKLVNITWKNTEIWYLTRKMREDEYPEKYSFHEKSSFGLVEGTIIIQEVK